MQISRSSYACDKQHPGLCSPFIHSVVSNDYLSGQWRSWIRLHRCLGWSGPLLSINAQTLFAAHVVYWPLTGWINLHLHWQSFFTKVGLVKKTKPGWNKKNLTYFLCCLYDILVKIKGLSKFAGIKCTLAVAEWILIYTGKISLLKYICRFGNKDFAYINENLTCFVCMSQGTAIPTKWHVVSKDSDQPAGLCSLVSLCCLHKALFPWLSI